MKTKHTAGDWKATKIDNGSISHVITSDSVIVANVNDLPNTFGSNEANAKLIAAAPELLEALQAIVNKVDSVKKVIEADLGTELNFALSVIQKAIN